MDKRKATMIAAAVLLMAGAGWALGFFGGDRAVTELQAMRSEMRDDTLSDDQRQQLRDDFRQRIESLSDSQRQAFFEAGRGEWNQRAEQRMDEFFTLTPVEQRQRLDDMIDRMLERSQNPQADRGPARPGGGRNLTDAQRDARAKQRLDRTTPKMRAQRDEFRQMLSARMQARGIAPDRLPGRWR
jgi:hypothetical protein